MTVLLRAPARAALAAFAFLTVLPVGRVADLDGTDVARGSVLFPVVGGLIGAGAGAVTWVAGDVLPPIVAAVLGVATGAVLTGALHLDGLADYGDSYGGRIPGDRLRIMRDHTIGTYGGTALLLDLLLRVSVLASLAASTDVIWLAAAAGALARVGGPVLSAWLPYAQAEPGAGEALSAHRSRGRTVAAVVVGLLIAAACLRVDAAVAVVATVVVIVALGLSARRRLGGVTGDVMGACAELIEVAVLVVVLAVR